MPPLFPSPMPRAGRGGTTKHGKALSDNMVSDVRRAAGHARVWSRYGTSSRSAAASRGATRTRWGRGGTTGAARGKGTRRQR